MKNNQGWEQEYTAFQDEKLVCYFRLLLYQQQQATNFSLITGNW
ncbi:hypothetical protein [Rufibacter roseus]